MTCHRCGCLAGLPAKQSRVQRLAVSEAHWWFDGDQSPAKSDAKAAHSKAPPSRRNDWQKDGGSSMEVVSSGVAAEVTRRRVLATSRVTASSRRRLPGKGKFRNHLDPHHSDPMILMTELFRLVRALAPPISKFRRPKSEDRMITSDEASSAGSLVHVNSFGVRISDFFRISGTRISDSAGSVWNASLPGAPASRRLGGNGEATCRRDDGAPR